MIVTLCGSNRFEADFRAAPLELGRFGVICFSLAVYPSDGSAVTTPGAPLDSSGYDKLILDLGYFKKIINSDAIIVVGDGYIGLSTAREILWADLLGKQIVWQKDHNNWESVFMRLRSRRTNNELISRARMLLGGPA